MHTCDLRSGGAQGMGGQDKARRSGAPGPHAHGNAATWWTTGGHMCVCSDKHQTTPATTSTAPVHQLAL